MGNPIFQLAKPPGADLGQHDALERYRLGHYHVESADPVGCHQKQAVVVSRVDVANLATTDEGQGEVG
jgi:hypothetical protein